MDFLANWCIYAPTLVHFWIASAFLIAFLRTRKFTNKSRMNAVSGFYSVIIIIMGVCYGSIVFVNQTIITGFYGWFMYSVYVIVPVLYYFTPFNKKNPIVGYEQPLDLFLYRKPKNVLQEPSGQTPKFKYLPALALLIGAMLLCTTIGIVGLGAQTCGWLDTSLGYSGCVRQITIDRKSTRSVKYSPNGTILAIGGSDALLQLVNAADGKLIRELKGHQNWVNALAFLPDGKTLASGSWDGTVKFWNVADGSLIRSINIPLSKGNSEMELAFSPDGSLLATGAYDTGVRIWQVSDGKEIKIIPDGSYGVAFSPDGTILAAAAFPATGSPEIILWRIKDWTKVTTLSGLKNIARSLTFSPDGEQLIGSDSSIFIWKVADGSLVRKIEDTTRAIAISPKVDLLVTEEGSYINVNPPNYYLKLWDLQKGQQIAAFGNTRYGINSISFSPDGQTVAVSNYEVVRLWKVKSST